MDVALVCLYGIILVVGLFSNISLAVTIFYGNKGRNWNPLLIGLIAADLIVCCVSGPLKALQDLIYAENKYLEYGMKILQTWPVSASSLILMSISMDRYLTVKNYGPTGNAEYRESFLVAACVCSWIIAALISLIQLVEVNPWRIGAIAVMQISVHILPISVVFYTNLAVQATLTALSLLARAKHGELPLPIPFIRAPKNVILAAGVATCIEVTPEIQTEDPEDPQPAAEDEELPPTSTLKCRRRIASVLMWMALIFTICWLPYVLCSIYEFNENIPIKVLEYTLLLGHAHSALNPILYFFLNYTNSDLPCRFRLPLFGHSPSSSTHESALGPFNPRYTRPPRSLARPQSSHFTFWL